MHLHPHMQCRQDFHHPAFRCGTLCRRSRFPRRRALDDWRNCGRKRRHRGCRPRSSVPCATVRAHAHAPSPKRSRPTRGKRLKRQGLGTGKDIEPSLSAPCSPTRPAHTNRPALRRARQRWCHRDRRPHGSCALFRRHPALHPSAEDCHHRAWTRGLRAGLPGAQLKPPRSQACDR
jgi:hypothetical protein